MAHINIAYVKNQPTPLYRVLSSKMVALLRVIFARWTKQRGQFKSSLPSFPFTIIMLLFCISLLKCFIYRRVNTSKILVVQQFLACLLRIRSRQYLFISSRKSYRPLQLSTAYSQEKLVTRKIMLIENISRSC